MQIRFPTLKERHEIFLPRVGVTPSGWSTTDPRLSGGSDHGSGGDGALGLVLLLVILGGLGGGRLGGLGLLSRLVLGRGLVLLGGLLLRLLVLLLLSGLLGRLGTALELS